MIWHHPLSKSIVPTQNLLRNRLAELTGDDRNVLEKAISQVRSYPAGQVLVREGMPVNVSTLLVKGFMTRHIDSPFGTRHLVAVHIPGDFVDLHAYAFKKLDHDVGTLTDVTVATFPHSALDHVLNINPRLTRRLWFLALLEGAMHRHWIYRLASLTAMQRVSHFLCEMNARLIGIGASDGNTFSLPMTQANLGEVRGLTNVHVNRVLRELREDGLCHIRASHVHINDLKRLVSRASFSPDYLHLNPESAARAAGRIGANRESSQQRF